MDHKESSDRREPQKSSQRSRTIGLNRLASRAVSDALAEGNDRASQEAPSGLLTATPFFREANLKTGWFVGGRRAPSLAPVVADSSPPAKRR